MGSESRKILSTRGTTMYGLKCWLSAILCIFVASCSSSDTNFQLGQLNAVKLTALKSDDPRLISARDACAKAIYAKGININGKKVTNRKVAISHLITYATAGGGQPKPRAGKAPFEDRLLKLENMTWECVKKKGFVKKTS